MLPSGESQGGCRRTVIVDNRILCILVADPEALCAVGKLYNLRLQASLLHDCVVDRISGCVEVPIQRRRYQLRLFISTIYDISTGKYGIENILFLAIRQSITKSTNSRSGKVMAVLPGTALAPEDARDSCIENMDGNREMGKGEVGLFPEAQLRHVDDLFGIGHCDECEDPKICKV